MTEKQPKKTKSAVAPPAPPPSARLPRAAGSGKQSNPAAALDAGLVALVDVLKRRRQRQKITTETLARRARVSVKTIQQFEAYQLNLVGLWDVISIATALGSRLTLELAPKKPGLPQTNPDILREFDQLVRGRKCNAFLRRAPDQKEKNVFWDIVGDPERNRLFVVACNPKKKVRFAKVTDEPGGFSIAGQLFGIDAETNQIAGQMAEQIMQEHRAELT